MTLAELSVCYEEAAVPLRRRLRELRLLLAATEDPEEIWRCKRRIAELTPMLTQMNELAELTAHYYDRGYYRNEEYTEFLGNRVVCHSLPIRPGRNLAVIVESAAVNHRQKKMGYNAAQELYRRVQENMSKKRKEEDE